MAFPPPDEPIPLPEVTPAPLEDVLPVTPAPRKPGPHLGWAILWLVGFFAFQLAITVGIFVVLAIMLIVREGPEVFKQHEGNPAELLLTQPGGFELLIVGITYYNLVFAGAVVGLMYRAAVWRRLAVRLPHPLHILLVVLLVVPLWLVAVQSALLFSRVLPPDKGTQEMMHKLVGTNWYVIVIAGCILPGIGEEIFFRGFLGRGLTARHGVWLGVLVTSLLFGIAHLNPPQIVGTFLLGLAFHVIYLQSKSLLAPMLAHALNNLLALALPKLLQLLFPESVAEAADKAKEHLLLPWLLVGAALLAALAVGWLFVASRVRWLQPDGQTWSPGYVTAEAPPAELSARAKLTRPPRWLIAVAAAGYLAFVAVLVSEIVKER